jgi:hypothetical protein
MIVSLPAAFRSSSFVRSASRARRVKVHSKGVADDSGRSASFDGPMRARCDCAAFEANSVRRSWPSIESRFDVQRTVDDTVRLWARLWEQHPSSARRH